MNTGLLFLTVALLREKKYRSLLVLRTFSELELLFFGVMSAKYSYSSLVKLCFNGLAVLTPAILFRTSRKKRKTN